MLFWSKNEKIVKEILKQDKFYLIFIVLFGFHKGNLNLTCVRRNYPFLMIFTDFIQWEDISHFVQTACTILSHYGQCHWIRLLWNLISYLSNDLQVSVKGKNHRLFQKLTSQIVKLRKNVFVKFPFITKRQIIFLLRSWLNTKGKSIILDIFIFFFTFDKYYLYSTAVYCKDDLYFCTYKTTFEEKPVFF